MAETQNTNGAISVNDDITPISKQPIQQVHADKWSDMSITELWEQRTTINNRLDYALQLGHADMIKQIQRGLLQLDQLIESRASIIDDTRLV